MIQIKKTILTLVALLAVTTGAWATTVTWVTEDFFNTGSAAFTKKDVTVTPSNNDARHSNYFYKQGANTFTTTLGNFTKIEIVFTPGSSPLTVSGWTYEVIEAVPIDPKHPEEVDYTSKLTWTGDAESVSIQGLVENIQSITFTIASPSSGPKVAWTAASKTGTFTMPGGNVTLEPEYYPQATVADGGVTAADADARATTDDPLVKVDATKLTGAKKLMYFVSNSGTTAPAYDAEGWTDQLPTAEGFTQQGIVYVWYYPVGTDEGVDGATATYSDGDICLQSITARIAAAPTYAVTFAEGTDPNEWKAEPATGVTKGQTVTVTYTGSKKVIGVKAEKKAAAPAGPITVTWNGADITGSGFGTTFTKDGVTITAGDIEFDEKNFIGGGTFTTTLGNFTKIEVTTDGWYASGTGWSGSTWTGNASSVSFSGEIMGYGGYNLKFVFTIEPTN